MTTNELGNFEVWKVTKWHRCTGQDRRRGEKRRWWEWEMKQRIRRDMQAREMQGHWWSKMIPDMVQFRKLITPCPSMTTHAMHFPGRVSKFLHWCTRTIFEKAPLPSQYLQYLHQVPSKDHIWGRRSLCGPTSSLVPASSTPGVPRIPRARMTRAEWTPAWSPATGCC